MSRHLSSTILIACDITYDFARTLDFCRDIADTLDMPTSGLDLRLERVAARVKLNDLAKAMGRHRATVGKYEDAGAVDPEIVQKYRQALATCSEVAESEGTAA